MIRIINGDCLQELPKLAASGERFHAAITDPPYHLTSIVKRFGGKNAAPAKHGTDGAFARASAGFMGAQWDGGRVAFEPETWRMVYDCMLPGAYLVAFASTRGYHRMVCAIEDAGFIIHPMVGWLFASGFPKAHKIDDPEWDGWRYGLQSLKPALEPICLAQKPMVGTGTANVLKYGCGALNIDASRIEGAFNSGWSESGSKASANVAMENPNRDREPKPDNAAGRWPANLLHDGSDEVLEAFAAFGEKPTGDLDCSKITAENKIFGARPKVLSGLHTGDSGTAARFFKSCEFTEEELRFHFCGKADAADRSGTTHPTTKPLSLMCWLVKLICPPGGRVIDPFAGSGSTGVACVRSGVEATLIEKEPAYAEMIKSRLRQEGVRGAEPDMSKPQPKHEPQLALGLF